MDVEEGRRALSNLVAKYLRDQEQVARLQAIIYSEPPRVPVRGILHEMESHGIWKQPLAPEDKELLDDLFYFFG